MKDSRRKLRTMKMRYDSAFARLQRIEAYVHRYCVIDKNHYEFPEVTLVTEHCLLLTKAAKEGECRMRLEAAEKRIRELEGAKA